MTELFHYMTEYPVCLTEFRLGASLFDRTAQKCTNTNILPKTPSSNQNFEKSP